MSKLPAHKARVTQFHLEKSICITLRSSLTKENLIAVRYRSTVRFDVSDLSHCHRMYATDSYETFLTIPALVEKDSILTAISHLQKEQSLQSYYCPQCWHFP